jgi:DNA-binding HxlR family transcriptional regulator
LHYRLTALGRFLDEPLAALREWAERHMPDIDDFARRSATPDQVHP